MGRRDLRFRFPAALLAVAFGVLALSGLGLALSAGSHDITTWWPASGVALAAMVFSPARTWPAVTVAIVLATGVAHRIDGTPAGTALALGAAVAAEALLGAVVLRRLGGVSARLDDPVWVLGMLTAAAVGTNAVTALLGGAASASAFDTGFPTAWARWFISHGIGILIVLPAVIAWRPPAPFGAPSLRTGLEAAGLTVSLGVLIVLVFARAPETDGLVGLPYLCLPPLMWAGLRFGARGATAATLALATAGSALTCGGRGPFSVASDPWVRVLNLQLFLLVATTVTLVAAITVDRRRRAERELQRSNNDLEQYAAAVSHDLVVPLRSIEGFVELLERDTARRLEPDDRRLLGVLGASAAQLRGQVLGLLELARAGSRLTLEAVPTHALVQRVLAALDEEVRSSRAEIEVGWLPHVIADSRQLELVFGNLVSNALKFHDGRPPHVRVQAHRIERAWCFSVTDRGPGIESEEAEQLFAHGYRGRQADGIEGRGLGLAIVRRVVEAHGGRIWATRGPEGGTRFEFLLPAED
jgi:signal transduction histidine kinase